MDIIIDDTGFNLEHWGRFGKQEFKEECLRQGVFSNYPEREEIIDVAYTIIYDATRAEKKG